MVAAKTVKKTSLQSVFGLSLLGYSRNMAVQHGGKGPAPSVDVRGSFQASKDTVIFSLHSPVWL